MPYSSKWKLTVAKGEDRQNKDPCPFCKWSPSWWQKQKGLMGLAAEGESDHKGQEGISQLKELIVQISVWCCYRPWTIAAIHQPHTLHESHSITSVKLRSKTKMFLWCQGRYSNTVRKITGPLPTQPPSCTTQDTAAQNTVRKLT